MERKPLEWPRSGKKINCTDRYWGNVKIPYSRSGRFSKRTDKYWGNVKFPGARNKGTGDGYLKWTDSECYSAD